MNSRMPRPVVVTFAVPDESRAFVAASERGPVLVVHTGVGDTPAGRRRLDDVLGEDDPPRLVISAGYAGALRPDLRVGDLVLGENFSDPGLLAVAHALLADEPRHIGGLVTQPAVAETAAAKEALHAATGALAVDMETAWIAEACARAGVPLLALRVVSDAAGQSFPVPNAVLYDAVRQRPRYVALPLWLLAHPWRIAPFVGFVRGLGPARRRLGQALTLLLTAPDVYGYGNRK